MRICQPAVSKQKDNNRRHRTLTIGLIGDYTTPWYIEQVAIFFTENEMEFSIISYPRFVLCPRMVAYSNRPVRPSVSQSVRQSVRQSGQTDGHLLGTKLPNKCPSVRIFHSFR